MAIPLKEIGGMVRAFLMVVYGMVPKSNKSLQNYKIITV